jgi:hypothetical protein
VKLEGFKSFEVLEGYSIGAARVDGVRFRMCWGSYHGPHKYDISLKDAGIVGREMS